MKHSLVGQFIDFDVFDAGLSWKERRALIEDAFPMLDQVDWQSLFREDTGLLGRIVNDIIRVDASSSVEKPRRGKRPNVGQEQAGVSLAQFQGMDYSMLPFMEAVNVLRGSLSVRGLASKVKLNKSRVQRLLEGNLEPSMTDMQAIAQAFGRDPGYFLEWRKNMLLGALDQMMSRYPESSVTQYLKVKR